MEDNEFSSLMDMMLSTYNNGEIDTNDMILALGIIEANKNIFTPKQIKTIFVICNNASWLKLTRIFAHLGICTLSNWKPVIIAYKNNVSNSELIEISQYAEYGY